MNKGPVNNVGWSYAKSYMDRAGIHASETAWVGGNIQYTITNDGTIDELFSKIKGLVEDRLLTS